MQKKRGFTIIEILFVIAIIGVMVTLGLSFVQKQSDNFKIKKTALQIQHILQGGTAYYAANNFKWPVDGVSNVASTFTTNYIGPGATLDPWGLPYTYGTDIIKNNSPINTFQVTVTLPNANIAKAVAALLPIAYTDTTNPAILYTYINIASVSTAQQGLLVTGYSSGAYAMKCDKSNASHNNPTCIGTIFVNNVPACPVGMSPILFTTYTGIRLQFNDRGDKTIAMASQIGDISTEGYNVNADGTYKFSISYTATTSLNVDTDTGQSYIYMNYLSLCKPGASV